MTTTDPVSVDFANMDEQETDSFFLGGSLPPPPSSSHSSSAPEKQFTFESLRHVFHEVLGGRSHQWACHISEHNSRSKSSSKKKDVTLFPLVESHFRDLLESTKDKEKKIEDASSWRMRQRMKTVSVALCLCLNIGTDPPDVVKTSPCARMQCWYDPASTKPMVALEAIGKRLQDQFQRWQSKARYKRVLDPTLEETRKLCVSLRRNAKGERILFHYNGHGVPRPTQNGEIWVFNKSYTQYIPLSVYDLQSWLGYPAIFTFDCSAAGQLYEHFITACKVGGIDDDIVDAVEASGMRESRRMSKLRSYKTSGAKRECIVLLPCAANELLPTNPDFPADLFTACLTTPIRMALRWFIMRNPLTMNALGITLDMVNGVPGSINNRKTPLGELNWIFTAITDTIAWNVLPRKLFQKLFRQDLLVASLFRNYLLAERILRSSNCTPMTYPQLPPTWQHPMWDAWDMAAENCLCQLPKLRPDLFSDRSERSVVLKQVETFSPYASKSSPRKSRRPVSSVYRNSTFFTDQLTAFEVWLMFGSSKQSSPEQLPIVLQVLLSQFHRLRALELLSRFLDLGTWAVSLALSVGIFPYVLKLLNSAVGELKPLLIHIWCNILAFDRSCQSDLVKDSSHANFIKQLCAPLLSADSNVKPSSSSSSSSGSSSASPPSSVTSLHLQRIQTCFILSVIVNHHEASQQLCVDQGILTKCRQSLAASYNNHCLGIVFRRWMCVCLGKIFEHNPRIRAQAIEDNVHDEILFPLLQDESAGVRASAAYALGLLVCSSVLPPKADNRSSDATSHGHRSHRRHRSSRHDSRAREHDSPGAGSKSADTTARRAESKAKRGPR